MLTRKYYRMIANAIQKSKDKYELIDMLSDELKKDNANFDRYIFKKACIGY